MIPSIVLREPRAERGLVKLRQDCIFAKMPHRKIEKNHQNRPEFEKNKWHGNCIYSRRGRKKVAMEY